MNEISFMVADQDASWQLLRIHDVDGTYYCHFLQVVLGEGSLEEGGLVFGSPV